MHPAEPSTHLLIVEDDPFIQRLLVLLLEPHYGVVVASDVEAALEAVAERRFDLVVIDINLRHRKTGIALLHALRLMPDYTTAPVLACTAYVQPEYRAHFHAEGFDGQIDKPFTREALLGAVAEALASAPALA